MASWLSENLNEREEVTSAAARLNGWSLTSTGTEIRYVAFKDGDRTVSMIAVPAGEERSISGLNEPYPNGLNEGKFINAKTDDDDVHMNILGYYVDKV